VHQTDGPSLPWVAAATATLVQATSAREERAVRAGPAPHEHAVCGGRKT
jgi:hypothetical protein